MAAENHRLVALTAPLSRFVEEQVADGRYASASEVEREGLRLLIERRDADTLLQGDGNQPHG